MSEIKLYKGDCLIEMQNIPDKSIDLTVTSPPYDNLRTYGGVIDGWSFEKFQGIAKELYRITKEGGVVVWVVGDATINGSETGTSFKQALYFMECGFNLHDTMIWEKKVPMPRDTRIPRYWQCFEYMFILSKGKPKHFNFLKEKTKYGSQQAIGYSRKSDGGLRLDRKNKMRSHIVKDLKPRHNIWIYASERIKGHPAPFPKQLASDHIFSWSNEGDTVLDCFMGSGSTGVACVNTKRNFIGIELNEEYFAIAEKRIKDAQQQLTLF